MVGDGDPRMKCSLGLDQPAPRRNIARGVDPIAHVGPKLFQSSRPWEQAPHANNRDLIVWMHHSGVNH